MEWRETTKTIKFLGINQGIYRDQEVAGSLKL